jgi:hypothetical protein
MPLPFLIIGAVIAAGVGVKKGIDGARDMSEAKDLSSGANSMVEEANDFIVMAKEKARTAIEALGSEKINVLAGSVNEFVNEYGKIKNISLKESEGIRELKSFNPDSPEFLSFKEASYEAKQIAVNGLAAIGSGALLAYGTYTVTMGGLGGLLVTATTGTALSSLSGAAATNATLAWLGGGALSAGGLGVTGGLAVLGGIVTGPALAIGGVIFASQARKALNEAQGNYDKARAFKQQAKNIGTALKAVVTRADQLRELLGVLKQYLERYNQQMSLTIQRKGTEWAEYSQSEQQDIYKCVQIALTTKTILDASLLKDDGVLDEATTTVLANGNHFLQQIQQI